MPPISLPLTLAYLGPGGLLSGAGGLIALGAATLLAIIGFVVYPLKRLLRARRGPGGAAEREDATA